MKLKVQFVRSPGWSAPVVPRPIHAPLTRRARPSARRNVPSLLSRASPSSADVRSLSNPETPAIFAP